MCVRALALHLRQRNTGYYQYYSYLGGKVMEKMRSAAVAGLFYPAEPSVLKTTLGQLLDQAEYDDQLHPPKVIIAPHAGYIYSGMTAAKVYKQLKPLKDTIKRVVIIGPAHRVSFSGTALSDADFFATPLGHVYLDKTANSQLLALDDVHLFDQAHLQEHSLEVHIPFLQYLLNDFSIIPIVAGHDSSKLIAHILELLWGGEETLIVISSDLSHFHDYRTAQSIDQTTAEAILNYDFNAIHPQQACGCFAINGLLRYARSHPLEVSLVDLRNSGDTAGDHDRVVGYGAFIFKEKPV